MADPKGRIDQAKDKTVGGIKEAAGKVTGNEELELKGKVQSLKGDAKGKAIDAGDKVDDAKEGAAGKVNDFIDKKKDQKEEK
ncbi:hypothetical protein [uncultured Acetobacterium sp.]|uniref:hypothetical protein n=1 Tax=uncultured Acetobacterium sp. TaxID=217139 RepID=UPI0025F2DC60|nr:hypothetical protein [uncultured Acetobacterium sp.]